MHNLELAAEAPLTFVVFWAYPDVVSYGQSCAYIKLVNCFQVSWIQTSLEEQICNDTEAARYEWHTEKH